MSGKLNIALRKLGFLSCPLYTYRYLRIFSYSCFRAYPSLRVDATGAKAIELHSAFYVFYVSLLGRMNLYRMYSRDFQGFNHQERLSFPLVVYHMSPSLYYIEIFYKNKSIIINKVIPASPVERIESKIREDCSTKNNIEIEM